MQGGEGHTWSVLASVAEMGGGAEGVGAGFVVEVVEGHLDPGRQVQQMAPQASSSAAETQQRVIWHR